VYNPRFLHPFCKKHSNQRHMSVQTLAAFPGLLGSTPLPPTYHLFDGSESLTSHHNHRNTHPNHQNSPQPTQGSNAVFAQLLNASHSVSNWLSRLCDVAWCLWGSRCDDKWDPEWESIWDEWWHSVVVQRLHSSPESGWGTVWWFGWVFRWLWWLVRDSEPSNRCYVGGNGVDPSKAGKPPMFDWHVLWFWMFCRTGENSVDIPPTAPTGGLSLSLGILYLSAFNELLCSLLTGNGFCHSSHPWVMCLGITTSVRRVRLSSDRYMARWMPSQCRRRLSEWYYWSPPSFSYSGSHSIDSNENIDQYFNTFTKIIIWIKLFNKNILFIWIMKT